MLIFIGLYKYHFNFFDDCFFYFSFFQFSVQHIFGEEKETAAAADEPQEEEKEEEEEEEDNEEEEEEGGGELSKDLIQPKDFGFDFEEDENVNDEV